MHPLPSRPVAPMPARPLDAAAAPAPRPLRLLSGAVAILAVAAGLAATAGTARAQALDIGTPSVLSQQGQRLKVAVPYGSAPGERVSVLRFTVASVSTDGTGARPPSAPDFVISQPERRNVIFLQSRELVNASSVKLVLAVAGPAPQQVTMDLNVPPPKAAPSESDPLNAADRATARPAKKAVRSRTAKKRQPPREPA